MMHPMDKNMLFLTDSGGIQAAAPLPGEPVLAIRDTAESPDSAEAGTTNAAKMKRRPTPYWNADPSCTPIPQLAVRP